MLIQVTRDKLLREHLYTETVDICKQTGSGYPGGVQWQNLLSSYFFMHLSGGKWQ